MDHLVGDARDHDAVTPARSRPDLVRVGLVAVVLVGVLLRAWRLGFNGLTYDESFTAMAARLPVDRLFDFLRTQDSHPPLDYLVRVPLARAGVSDVALRLPSFACSVGALVLFAWWMRTRGLAGLVATAVLACSAFQILHGGEARMYALLELVGVSGAMLAARWRRDPRAHDALLVAGLVALALFDHISGVLFAGGMVAVAGVRNDRQAWQWRGAVLGAGLVWTACWGASFADQAGGDWTGWIPRTSFGSFARAVSGQVVDVESVALLVFALVVAGGSCLWRSDRELGWIWCTAGGVPFLLAAAIGTVSPFLIDRAVTVASWAPALALGFLAEYLIARGNTVGRALVILGVLLVLAGSVTFLASKRYDSDLAVAHLREVVQPGDTIVTRPSRYDTLPGYRIGVQQWGEVDTVDVPGVSMATGIREHGAAPTRRYWLFSPVSFELMFPGYGACRPTAAIDVRPWTDGVTNIRCLERTTP